MSKNQEINELEYLEQEAKRSLSGISLDVAWWFGMETAYRWISYNRIGPWRPSLLLALEAYKETEDKNFLNNT